MQAVRKYYEALHQIPECSGAERETAAYVSDVLFSLGYTPQQYPCGGVSADLVRALGSLLPDLTQNAEPSLAAEDFACYQQHIPGVLLWLGIGDTAPLHSPQFCLPEQILQDGVDAWLTIAAHPWRMTNR